MALLNICRRGRTSWQHALRAASSLHLTDGSTAIRAPWSAQPQWFHSSSATAVPAAADDAAAPKPPPKRRVDTEEVMNTAERIFNSSMDAQPASSNEAPGGAGTGDNVSPEMVEEHASRVAYTQRKREKNPPKQMLTIEEWLGRNHGALQPFIAFLRSHGVPEEREPLIVSSLFKSGFRGRHVMLNRSPKPVGDDHETDGAASHSQPPKPTYEETLEAWNEALAHEDIGLSGEDLLRGRWNAMLSRTPENLSATLALLRAAIPDEQQLRAIVANAPRLLGNTPESLQNRLIQLQMATEGELQQLLAAAPRILETPMDSILSNLRLLRLHSATASGFRGLIASRPNIICNRPHQLQDRVGSIVGELGAVLPQGVAAVEILKQKPQLLLSRASWLVQRWKALEAAAISVPSWAEELDGVVFAAAAYKPPLREQDLEGAMPEWADVEGKDPSEVGINLAAEEEAAERRERQQHRESREEAHGRRAYAALAEALWARERRFQRLVYLIQELPEQAGRVSLISTLTVRLDRFQRRFPEFEDWRAHQEVMHRQDKGEDGSEAADEAAAELMQQPSAEQQQQQ